MNAAILDLNGRRLVEQVYRHGGGVVEGQMDIDLAPGMYLLEVEANGQRAVKRIAVQ